MVIAVNATIVEIARNLVNLFPVLRVCLMPMSVREVFVHLHYVATRTKCYVR